MEDNIFFLKIVKYVALVICTIIISITGGCQLSKYQIRKMVDAGASPTEAACAYAIQGEGMSAGDASICTLFLTEQ